MPLSQVKFKNFMSSSCLALDISDTGESMNFILKPYVTCFKFCSSLLHSMLF